MERKIDWQLMTIRAGYLAGAILDLISALASIIYMFSSNENFIHQILGWPVVNDGAYMILITECALMFGWTALLVWGMIKPIERRGVLLLTVIPVVSMIIIFNIIALVEGNMFWSLERLILPASVIILIIIGYILSEIKYRKTQRI